MNSTTRRWDCQAASFQVTNASGDVHTFGRWRVNHFDGIGYCGNIKGFRLNSWTLPQGPSLNRGRTQFS